MTEEEFDPTNLDGTVRVADLFFVVTPLLASNQALIAAMMHTTLGQHEDAKREILDAFVKQAQVSRRLDSLMTGGSVVVD